MKVHKTIAEAKAHLGESTVVIPQRYKEATAKANWEEPSSTPESEANYQAGLTESIAANRRVEGIRAAGNRSYQEGCATKGFGVIAQRIKGALDKYGRKFEPVLSAMNAASDAAPAHVRDFRANIANRLTPVVEAARRAAGKPD